MIGVAVSHAGVTLLLWQPKAPGLEQLIAGDTPPGVSPALTMVLPSLRLWVTVLSGWHTVQLVSSLAQPLAV